MAQPSLSLAHHHAGHQSPALPSVPISQLPAPLVDGQKLLRLQDVLALVGFSRATLYRYTNVGRFPAPVRVGPRRVVWRASDLNTWFSTLQQT